MRFKNKDHEFDILFFAPHKYHKRLSYGSTDIILCPNKFTCLGGNKTNLLGSCSKGYRGFLCGSCDCGLL